MQNLLNDDNNIISPPNINNDDDEILAQDAQQCEYNIFTNVNHDEDCQVTNINEEDCQYDGDDKKTDGTKTQTNTKRGGKFNNNGMATKKVADHNKSNRNARSIPKWKMKKVDTTANHNVLNRSTRMMVGEQGRLLQLATWQSAVKQ